MKNKIVEKINLQKIIRDCDGRDAIELPTAKGSYCNLLKKDEIYHGNFNVENGPTCPYFGRPIHLSEDGFFMYRCDKKNNEY